MNKPWQEWTDEDYRAHLRDLRENPRPFSVGIESPLLIEEPRPVAKNDQPTKTPAELIERARRILSRIGPYCGMDGGLTVQDLALLLCDLANALETATAAPTPPRDPIGDTDYDGPLHDVL